jgi:hypothetical protein
MYKPLPDSLTIKQSGINGLGLFAKENIGQGTNLGMSHVEIEDTIIGILLHYRILKREKN